MKRLPFVTGMALALVVLCASLASAQVSINIEVEPRLVPVPGAPVYYAPELLHNVFRLEGRYYLFSEGVWYVAPTYRGPWAFVPLVSVPLPLLSVPVDYYRAPLYGWRRGGPPPWARHREEYREREARARREWEHERRERREDRWEDRERR